MKEKVRARGRRCVAVVCRSDLLGDGLSNLVRRRRGVDFVIIRDEPESALEQVRKMRPDTVVIESSGEDEDQLVSGVVAFDSDIRIILVGLAESRIQVLDKRHIEDGGWKELWASIRRP